MLQMRKQPTGAIARSESIRNRYVYKGWRALDRQPPSQGCENG